MGPVEMKISWRLLPGLLLALVTGCQTARPVYYWGNYEPTIYQSYAKPGKNSVDEQILKLQEDVTKAAAAGLSVHPGLHAHLGYLHATNGHNDSARKEFEAEKNLFPESAAFMDRMLKQLETTSAK